MWLSHRVPNGEINRDAGRKRTEKTAPRSGGVVAQEAGGALLIGGNLGSLAGVDETRSPAGLPTDREKHLPWNGGPVRRSGGATP